MKILHGNNYQYVGVKDGLHMFVSIRKDFDPEVILLERAKFINGDNSVIFYDPVEDIDRNWKDVDYVYEGTDAEGNKYHILLECKQKLPIGYPMSPAVSVNHSEYQERNLKRRLVRYENLIKTAVPLR